jgi:hypothetical protein
MSTPKEGDMAWLDENVPRGPEGGYAPSTTTDIDGFRAVTVLLILLLPFVFSLFVSPEHRPAAPTQTAAALPGTPAERLGRITARHFAAGEEFLRWGDYVSALDKFETVQNIDPRYPAIAERLAEARSGLAGVTPPTTQQAAATRAAQRRRADGISERRVAGPVLQERLARKGHEIRVTVSGAEAEKVQLTSVLFDDTWPQRLEEDGTFAAICDLGFSSVEMVDGFQYRATRSCE